ncbi:MAG: hypothetical protein AB1631_12395 [Acidobacteriota bacterium]
MKICPDCNERFPDEMKYCDLDGNKLLREPGSEGQDQSRLWSLIGVGILVGAILIITISVLFSPRTPDTPAIARSAPVTQQTPQPSSPEQSVKPDVVIEELPIAETKKKEKPADAANSNSALNPKDAFKETGEETEATKTDSKPESPKTASSETDKAAPVAAKPKEADPSASKSAPTAADAKSDKKKESEKKEEKKDEKKKGGLFRFFKKIFGKG